MPAKDKLLFTPGPFTTSRTVKQAMLRDLGHRDLEEFYRRLNDKGYVIYPGKASQEDCFRIGTISRIYPSDMEDLLGAIGRTVAEMGI